MSVDSRRGVIILSQPGGLFLMTLRFSSKHPFQNISRYLLNPSVLFAEVPFRRIDKTRRTREEHIPPTGSRVEDNVGPGAGINGGGMRFRFLPAADGAGGHHDEILLASHGTPMVLPADEVGDCITLLHPSAGKHPVVRDSTYPVCHADTVRLCSH